MQVRRNGRIRRSEQEWRRILERWEASGLGSREFCRREQLHISSFQRWQGRLHRPSTRKDFVTVLTAPAAAAPPSSWSMELTLPNGSRLVFRG